MRPSALVCAVILGLSFACPAGAAEGTGEISGQVKILTADNQPTGDNSGVVVYIREVNQNKGFKASKTPLSMASENMEFEPGILPILVGSSVVFPNHDDTKHNAFSLSKSNPFDLGVYNRGQGKKVVFKNPGQVNVNCNLHPHMAGYILVLENPYFTVTDDKGGFSIKNVPAGEYSVVCWFPYGFIQEHSVAVKASEKAGVDFELVKVRDEVPHKNKFGKSY